MLARIKLAIFLLAIWPGAAAVAHPHIFVDARTGFLFSDDGQLHGLRISWTYDPFTSLFLYDTLNLDADGDELLNDADRAAIVAGETDWPEDYLGDIYLELDGQDRPLTRPEHGVASLADGLISVSFDLPLAEPANLSGRTAILRLYDPIFYYAYTILDDEDLSIAVPSACTSEVIPFQTDAATAELQVELRALSREDVPEQENVGRLFSDEVRLICP